MKKYFSIGETAKINNISIQALRLYDKMGLLKPAYVDQQTNYRYYTIDQFIYLDLIKYSKYIGYPLKELNDLLHNKDIVKLLSIIKKQQKIVEKEIIRLNKISKDIGRIENKIKYAIELKETNEIYFRKIKKRFIMDTLLNKKDKEIDIEIKIRKLDKILEENDMGFEGETGYFIYLDSFLNESEICYKSLYSTIYADDIENNTLGIKDIPGGKFICIAYLNNEREVASDKLRKYIEENNINTIGIGVEVQLFNTLEQ
ncbi:MerR family transcriptional regulator [Tepidibacter aestuarii]|uniref:MerR family transcriptional regulator n=1 Tax=Tepidibacter aestuarii TaxID=2925782 RepID=UPI0020BF1D75|nr:helix-turn-helix domain-containing protein [Tepidibacter aestuarii]CAH2214403.1 MerR family transcriptional regulator, activator of bmr gene [Tepidibacter aestuarii]